MLLKNSGACDRCKARLTTTCPPHLRRRPERPTLPDPIQLRESSSWDDFFSLVAISVTARSILYGGGLGRSDQSGVKSIDFGATAHLAANRFRACIPEFNFQLSLPTRDRDDNIVNTSSLP